MVINNEFATSKQTNHNHHKLRRNGWRGLYEERKVMYMYAKNEDKKEYISVIFMARMAIPMIA